MGLVIVVLVLLLATGFLNFGGVVALGAGAALVNILFYVFVAALIIALVRFVLNLGNDSTTINRYDID